MNKNTKFKDAVNCIAGILGPLKKKLKKSGNFVSCLTELCQKVADFRQPMKITYRLSDILCICLLIAMRGKFTSFHGASAFIKANADHFTKLGLIDGKHIPSHDTLRRIFMNIDADKLRHALADRLKNFMQKILDSRNSNLKKFTLLSGDGKTFNGSGRRDGTRNINVFNLFDASKGMIRNSLPLDDKDSEIPAFQKLLRRYNLKQTMVTGDALHAQIKTCDIISNKGGLYTFTVKDNQQTKREHIIDVMRLNEKQCLTIWLNNCQYSVCLIDYELTCDDFPHAKAFVRMISHKRKDQADYNPVPQYFVSSSDDPLLIAETIDNRQQVERMHLWKDQFLKEDACTFMDKNAIGVMANLNNVVYTFYQIAAALFNSGDMALTWKRFDHCPERMLKMPVPLLQKQNLTMLLKQSRRGSRQEA